MNGPETRESLLAELNKPFSNDKWYEFVQIYRPLIIRVAMVKGLQFADAEDLTQEVFSVVRRSLEKFDSSRGSFRSWLYQITRNLVVNQLTRVKGPIGTGDSKVGRVLAQHPQSNEALDSLFKLEYRRLLFQKAADQARSEFQKDTWDAFWLTAVESKSIASVSAMLGKSQGAIRVARCRVLDRLRRLVDESDDSIELCVQGL